MKIAHLITDSLIFSAIFIGFKFFLLWLNPRLMLHRYPAMIQQQVPCRTPGEKRYYTYFLVASVLLQGLILLGRVLKAYSVAPISYWIIMVHVLFVLISWNVLDFILIDWLLIYTLTPSFVMIPGAETPEDYRHLSFYLKDFQRGLVASLIASCLLAGISYTLLTVGMA